MPTEAIAVVAVCPDCGTEVSTRAKFCSECGHPVAGLGPLSQPGAVERMLAAASMLEGERKLVTVLFADLRGSTQLIADRDPEEARRVLEPVLERICGSVESYGGTVSQVMGDGVMAIFGAPVSLEDHAIRACHAALAMQERIGLDADDIQRACGVPVQIRVGLSSGEVVLGVSGHGLHISYTAIGETVHLAARMEQLAKPGTVLSSASTVQLASAFIGARRIGPVAVKGFERPVEIFEIERPPRWRSRFDIALVRGATPFTGRDAELRRMLETLDHVIDDGSSRLAIVAGEAGIGKSRLMHEFLKELTRRNVLALDGGAAPYGSGAWYRPGVHILRQYFEIADSDSVEAQQQKVAGRIIALGGDVNAVAAPILLLLHALPDNHRLFGLALKERRDLVFAALMWLAARITAERPLVFIFEDLQWATSDTRDFLHAFVHEPPRSTLVVLTYRADYDGHWAEERAALQLRLEGLAAPAAQQMVAGLLGRDQSLAELSDTLVHRSGGNPLFIEEYARSTVETGSLTGSPGNYRMETGTSGPEVPPTVRAVLASRIDRLERIDKHVLQALSAFGEFATVNVLQQVADEPADAVARSLRRLELAGMLVARSDRELPCYEFKHALTQAVTYDTLLQERRLKLHRAILGALEGSADVDVLARHALAGEVWDRALVHLREAGRRSAAQFASSEAISCFERALGVLERLPKTREAQGTAFDILCDMRNVLAPLGEHDRLRTVLESASALAKALGDEERLARVYSFLSSYYGYTGRSKLAVETGERALVLGQRVGAVDLLIVGSMSVGEICRTRGEYPKARDLLRQALAHIGPGAELDRLGYVGLPAVRARSHLAWTLAELGDFAAARAAAEEGLRIANMTGHPYDLAHACLGLGGVRVRQGEFEAAVPVLVHGLAFGERVPMLRPPLAADLGVAKAFSGDIDEGLALVNEAVEHANVIGRISRLPLLIVKRGDVHLLAGDTATAGRCAAEALTMATDQDERGNAACAMRLQAAIVAVEHPGSPEVETQFTRTLQLAHKLGMRPLVAHCHAGLALHHARGSSKRSARAHRVAAARLYRAMGMRYWLGQLDQSLLECGCTATAGPPQASPAPRAVR